MKNSTPLVAAAITALFAASANALPPGTTAVGIGFENIGELVTEGDPPDTFDILKPVIVHEYYAGGNTLSRTTNNPVNLNGSAYGIAISSDGLGIQSFVRLPVPGTGPFGPRWRDGDATDTALTELGQGAFYVLPTQSGGSGQATIQVQGGFNNWVSFWYSSYSNPKVEVLDKNGDIIASGSFSATAASGCGTENLYCRWTIGTIDLSGGKGRSVRLSVSNDGVSYFDNVTFGSARPLDGTYTGQVPEPGTYALMALGLAAVGFVARRRRA